MEFQKQIGVVDTRVPKTWGYGHARPPNMGFQTCDLGGKLWTLNLCSGGGRSEVWVDTTCAKADADEQRRGKRSQGTTGVFQT